MKISNDLDARIKQSLESDNERALRQLMDKKPAFSIPMHTANMRMIVEDTSREDSIRQTIIPEMTITLDPIGIKGDEIAKQSVYYKIPYNNQAFPIAHVYSGSGSLCLGSIFVPSYIPKYSPQQPLETLFLYNDRHTAHGHPVIPLDKTKIQAIGKMLYELDPEFPVDVHHKRWVKQDTLWRIGEVLLKLLPKDQAFEKMNEIFHLIFDQETYTVNGRQIQV